MNGIERDRSDGVLHPFIDRTDGVTIRSLFLESVARFESNIALVVGGRSYRFSDLDALARVWAAAILDGPAPVRSVGVFAQKSELAFVGILAAMYAGASFVPMNRTFPAARSREMADVADIDTLLAEPEAFPLIESMYPTGERRPRLLFPATPASSSLTHVRLVDGERDVPLKTLPPLVCYDLAYLLFTSGSTGKPKGVMVTHANLLHFAETMRARYEPRADDRFSNTADLTFDLAMFDLLLAWSAGASIHVPRPIELLAPSSYVAQNSLTFWISVPSVAALALQRGLPPGAMPSLRWSLFCGEALSVAVAEAWQRAAPNGIVENLYGPTEAAVACVAHRFEGPSSEHRNGIVPIGRPSRDIYLALLNEDGTPTGSEEIGELCIGGPQVSPGYKNDKQLSATRFVHLEGSEPPLRVYKTGDLVTHLPSGAYAFVGRADDQVKIGGYRVELGDIEAVARAFPKVNDTAAVGWPSVEGLPQGVVLFVTCPPDLLDSLRASMVASLPTYMIPRQIISIDQFPLNANSKIDRRKLREHLDDPQQSKLRVHAIR